MRVDERRSGFGGNSLRKGPARWRIKLIEVLFSGYGVAIGVGLIVCAGLLHEHLIVSTILLGIGPALIVLGLFEIIYQHFLRQMFLDDVLLAQKTVISGLLCSYGHVRSQGIRDVYSSLPSGKLRKLLRRSTRIRILKTWFPSDVGLVKGLLEALSGGALVELFLCDPDSQIMQYRSTAAGCDQNEGLARDLEAVKMALNAIAQGFAGRISIYFYNAWPGSPVIDCDSGVFEGSLLRGLTSPLSQWLWIDPDSEHGKALLAQFDFNDHEITARLTSEQTLRRWYDKHSPHRPSKGEADA
jgi:hypothetical protein